MTLIIWDSFPKLKKILKVLLIFLVISTQITSLFLLSNARYTNIYTTWYLAVIIILPTHSSIMNIVIGYRRTTMSNLILYWYLSMFVKIWGIFGIMLTNPLKSNYNTKILCILNLVLYNCFAYWDVLLFVITTIIVKLIKNNIILLNPEILEINLANSDILESNDEYIGKECSICLDEITNESIVRKTICNHVFHDECVIPWFKITNSCPLCRHEFVLNTLNDRSLRV